MILIHVDLGRRRNDGRKHGRLRLFTGYVFDPDFVAIAAIFRLKPAGGYQHIVHNAAMQEREVSLQQVLLGTQYSIPIVGSRPGQILATHDGTDAAGS